MVNCLESIVVCSIVLCQPFNAQVKKCASDVPVHEQMYQKDNGLVIHLRAGARDKGLFYFTTGLLFAVIGLSAQGWYTMAMKGR